MKTSVTVFLSLFLLFGAATSAHAQGIKWEILNEEVVQPPATLDKLFMNNPDSPANGRQRRLGEGGVFRKGDTPARQRSGRNRNYDVTIYRNSPVARSSNLSLSVAT